MEDQERTASMPKLIVFNTITVDGYFTDKNNDMSWAHQGDPDPEFDEFVAGNASGGGVLVFGRKTYELMASFWPTPAAAEQMPVVAEQMNSRQKVVFSRTLEEASWSNTRLVKGDLVAEIQRMKSEPGEGLAILGSGSLVAQLAQAGLIDEYQMVVAPLALGAGRTIFEGMQERLSLRLTKSRTFRNGKAFLCYEPAR
jgi:dihydrofolate reductase